MIRIGGIKSLLFFFLSPFKRKARIMRMKREKPPCSHRRSFKTIHLVNKHRNPPTVVIGYKNSRSTNNGYYKEAERR
jgi:hypothetical protein